MINPSYESKEDYIVLFSDVSLSSLNSHENIDYCLFESKCKRRLSVAVNCLLVICEI